MLAYLVSLTLTFIVLNKKKNITYPLPIVEFKDKKICFFSNKRHKIFVGFCKALELDNKVFLKQNGKLVKIENIKNIKQKNGWLFFDALGNVEIFIGNKKWLRYAELNIYSNQFDLTKLKYAAGCELVNNLFDCTKCTSLLRYLKFVKGVLKIELTSKGIKVKQNVYGLTFCLNYNFCGKQKHIIFN